MWYASVAVNATPFESTRKHTIIDGFSSVMDVCDEVRDAWRRAATGNPLDMKLAPLSREVNDAVLLPAPTRPLTALKGAYDLASTRVQEPPTAEEAKEVYRVKQLFA